MDSHDRHRSIFRHARELVRRGQRQPSHRLPEPWPLLDAQSWIRMKRLIAALVALVVVGIVAWFKIGRDLQPTQTESAGLSATQVEEMSVAVQTLEADPPEPSPDNAVPASPGPVLPKPRPMSV